MAETPGKPPTDKAWLGGLSEDQVKAALAEAKLMDQLPLSLREESGEIKRYRRGVKLSKGCLVGSMISLAGAVLADELWFMMRGFLVLGLMSIMFKIDAGIIESKRLRRARVLHDLRTGRSPRYISDTYKFDSQD